MIKDLKRGSGFDADGLDLVFEVLVGEETWILKSKQLWAKIPRTLKDVNLIHSFWPNMLLWT